MTTKTRRRAEPPASGRTQPQRTARTRMQILRAASETFGRLGYAGTRVEDILAASEVSRPTFYRFFDSKEHVFDALDEMASLSLLQMVSSAMETAGSHPERLKNGVEAYLRWLATTGPLAAVLLQESARPDSQLAPRRETTHKILVNYVDEGLYAFRGKRYDPIFIVTLLTAIENVGHFLLQESPRLTEKHVQRGVRIALRIVLGALTEGDPRLPKIPERS